MAQCFELKRAKNCEVKARFNMIEGEVDRMKLSELKT
jgi:hypothetical protein